MLPTKEICKFEALDSINRIVEKWGQVCGYVDKGQSGKVKKFG
jgi:hypothetical protein